MGSLIGRMRPLGVDKTLTRATRPTFSRSHMKLAPLFAFAVSLWLCCGESLRAAIVHHAVEGDPPEIGYFPLNLPQDIDINGDGIFDFTLLPVGLATALSAPG